MKIIDRFAITRAAYKKIILGIFMIKGYKLAKFIGPTEDTSIFDRALSLELNADDRIKFLIAKELHKIMFPTVYEES